MLRHFLLVSSPPLSFSSLSFSPLTRLMSTSASSSSSSPHKKYAFTRTDFPPLVTRPLHLYLHFDVLDSRVLVDNHTTFHYSPSRLSSSSDSSSSSSSSSAMKMLTVDCRSLEIVSVERVTEFQPLPSSLGRGDDNAAAAKVDFQSHLDSFVRSSYVALPFTVDEEKYSLTVDWSAHANLTVKSDEQFVLRFVTICKPTHHILEGIYYDFTPTNCPKTMISQCQQYGFQRITPALDHMTAKSYWTTHLVADKRYTNLLTNGDLAPDYCVAETGEARPKDDTAVETIDKLSVPHPRHCLRYHTHVTNMASYLFLFCAGTYDNYRRHLEYPNGDIIHLELLSLSGLVEGKYANQALQALHDSIMWCHLSTGPEAHLHQEERQRAYKLVKEREILKERVQKATASASAADADRLVAVRIELNEVVSAWKKLGYKYTGKVYREIAMQNSSYGGMENVGNTTIIASRIAPSPLQSDAGYVYYEGVKIHEYYHNINGSEVTGCSPFCIWLNEAVTVHIQEQREENLFGKDFMRLKTVTYAFMPALGPLAMDRSPISMAIEPEGFNDTTELITAMTYSKAPEFIRMVSTIIGRDKFNIGLDHYHTKFKYSNANTSDWVEAMEWTSGLSLKTMAKGWLTRTSYPDVSWTGQYDNVNNKYIVQVEQSVAADGQGWEFPIDYALVKDGKNVREGVWTMKNQSDEFVIDNVTVEPDFLSFARHWSFFGTHKNSKATRELQRLQALTDPDVINRYFAYRAFCDGVKADLTQAIVTAELNSKQVEVTSVDQQFVELHARILFDDSITPSTRAMMLAENEDLPSHPHLQHYYWALYYAKTAMLQAVYDAHAERIVSVYETLAARNVPGPHLVGLHDRALKAHLYRLMHAGVFTKSVLPSRQPPAVRAEIAGYAKGLVYSPFMTDQTFGLAQYLSGPATDYEKRSVQNDVLTRWSAHPDTVESYIGVICSLDVENMASQIRDVVDNKSLFNIALAGHARSVARGLAGNRKRSLLTEEGLTLTTQLFIEIGKVNQMSAQAILRAFSDVERFKGSWSTRLVKALQNMYDGLDPKREESLCNQLRIMLDKVGDAKKNEPNVIGTTTIHLA